MQGFVRPRALAVTADGSMVYVADACEATPEKIWIFTRTENPRTRRNTKKGDLLQREDENVNHIAPFIEARRNAARVSPINVYENPVFRYLTTKGQLQLRQIDEKASKVP